MQESAREGIAVYNSRFEIHRDDGTTIVLEGVAQPLLGAKGERRGSFGLFFEITRGEQSLYRLCSALEPPEARANIIRMCASCRKVAEADDEWTSIETFLAYTHNARFSHGLCPDCFKEAMRELQDGGRPSR